MRRLFRELARRLTRRDRPGADAASRAEVAYRSARYTGSFFRNAGEDYAIDPDRYTRGRRA